MFNAVLELLSSLVISPLLFCYAYLLNDQWRLPRWALAVVALLSGFTAQAIAGIPDTSVVFRIVLIELCNVSVLVLCSRVRDARLLFVLCTAGMFDFMMTAVCGIFAYPMGIHRLFIRLLADGLLLGLGARFFRPVFLDVFRSVRRGWLFLSLFPVILAGMFAVILIQPNYILRYSQPETRWIAGSLSILLIVIYVIFFRFFQQFNAKQHSELDSHILHTQFQAIQRQTEDYQTAEERARIFRHDLRHRLRMLEVCIEQGDDESAERLLADVAQMQQEAARPSKQGGGG